VRGSRRPDDPVTEMTSPQALHLRGVAVRIPGLCLSKVREPERQVSVEPNVFDCERRGGCVF